VTKGKMFLLHKNVYFSTVDQHTEENAPSEKSGIPKKRKRGHPRKEQGTLNLLGLGQK
jgi:hypothetical protein